VLDAFSQATEIYVDYLKKISLADIVAKMKKVDAPFMAYPAGSKPKRSR
jgi:hypothetical protein